jgi:hypothetical protein
MQQTDQPGLAFDQRADRRMLVFADDQIALPVTSLRAIVGLRGRWCMVSIACSDLEPTATAFAALMSAAMVTSAA